MADSVLDALLPPCEVLVDRDTHGPPVPLARRRGVMIHFDDSSNDEGALSWFRAPGFRLSYNRATRDDGTRIRITPSIHHAAYHAGICLREPGVPDAQLGGASFTYGGANTAYFGLAVTAGVRDLATLEQYNSLAEDCAVIWRVAGWPVDDLEVRIVGHDERAIFNPRDNPGRPDLWGKLGRKVDPTGLRSDGQRVVDLDRLREGVATYLNDPTAPLWRNWPEGML